MQVQVREIERWMPSEIVLLARGFFSGWLLRLSTPSGVDGTSRHMVLYTEYITTTASREALYTAVL